MSRTKRIEITRKEIERLSWDKIQSDDIPVAPNGSGGERIGKWDTVIKVSVEQIDTPSGVNERSLEALTWGPFNNRDEAKACANALGSWANGKAQREQINWKFAYRTSETAGRWYCYIYKVGVENPQKK